MESEGAIPEWMAPVLDGFVGYGARDRDPRRAADRLIAARGRDLPAGEVAAFGALSRARASLFEIVDVQIPGSPITRGRRAPACTPRYT